LGRVLRRPGLSGARLCFVGGSLCQPFFPFRALSRLAGHIGESPVQIATTAADVLLCYSRTVRTVSSILSGAPVADGGVPPGAADDAREVVTLLDKSCPELLRGIKERRLRLSGVYSEDYQGRPHPVTVLVTAHCEAGMPRRASEICALVSFA